MEGESAEMSEHSSSLRRGSLQEDHKLINGRSENFAVRSSWFLFGEVILCILSVDVLNEGISFSFGTTAPSGSGPLHLRGL
jgi:hypothetical protein